MEKASLKMVYRVLTTCWTSEHRKVHRYKVRTDRPAYSEISGRSMRASLDRSAMSFNGNLRVFKEMVRVPRPLFRLNQRNGLQQDRSIFQANSKSSTISKKNVHLYLFDIPFSQFTPVYDNFEENFADKIKYRRWCHRSSVFLAIIFVQTIKP